MARRYLRDRLGRFSGKGGSGGSSRRRRGRHSGAFRGASVGGVQHSTVRWGQGARFARANPGADTSTLERLHAPVTKATGGGFVRGANARRRSNRAARRTATNRVLADSRVGGVVARNKAKSNRVIADMQRRR